MKEPIGHIAATSGRGSALILTVVLTSLLAIVGVLFVMGARIDKMATTAATESRELTCAVDTVLSEIDQALVEDVPGVTADQEYYDYPDDYNPWLADLEPYAVVTKASDGTETTEYYWRQISNVGGILTSGTKNILIKGVVGEREEFDKPDTLADPDVLADADGDGVPDAKWFQVPSVMTSKGKRFYAAVRIVDNGGMLNMNTGFRFDPNDPNGPDVDGTSPLQVNAVALARSPKALLDARANSGADPVAAGDLAGYEKNVIWQYMDVKNLDDDLPSPYTPFDIADELTLRYRYLLQHLQGSTATSRVELCGLFRDTSWTPVESGGNSLDQWFKRAADVNDPNYAYRHIATTYNMDRIITSKPVDLEDGTKRTKMVNVNTTDELTLRLAIAAALFEASPNADPGYVAQRAAQITANLRDYVDDDDEMTVIPGFSSPFFGFERPCIYISEVACRQVRDAAGVHTSYAVELYRPYFEDRDPNSEQWSLRIEDTSGVVADVSLEWSGSRRFHVILAEDPAAPLSDDYLAFADAEEPVDTMPRYGYNRSDYKGEPQKSDPGSFKFRSGAAISLKRKVAGAANPPSIDYVRVPEGLVLPDASVQGSVAAKNIQRDISPHKCIRRLWSPRKDLTTKSLGSAVGNYVDSQRPEIVQAHPANRPLTNIGELGMLLAENAYSRPEGALEADVLLDLTNPAFSRLFNYLTVIDPTQHTGRQDETRIMGRININTAPALVLAQLPWLSYKGMPVNSPAGGAAAVGSTLKIQQAGASGNSAIALTRAQEIVKYRETRGPYRSTGDLMQIPSMRVETPDGLNNQHSDMPRGPDLTPDTARDDFEERDLIFTRISDLVTVRSDVFTAYVLVRIGAAGPQRRIIVIFDRSRVDSAGGRVRILAHHPVPDPR